MRAEGLEAEKKLLTSAEQRAATEAAELSREKFRLAAELQAARKVHADREAELLAEVARLKEEVSELGRQGGGWKGTGRQGGEAVREQGGRETG